MTTRYAGVEADRRARAIASSVSRIMRLRDRLRGEVAPAQPFLAIGCGDGRVAALVSDQDVFGDQFVNGFAQGSDRYAKAQAKLLFGRYGFTWLPFTLRKSGQHLALNRFI